MFEKTHKRVNLVFLRMGANKSDFTYNDNIIVQQISMLGMGVFLDFIYSRQGTGGGGCCHLIVLFPSPKTVLAKQQNP